MFATALAAFFVVFFTAPTPAKANVVAEQRLIIPVLGVNAVVKNTGLEGDGRMAVPHNYTEVGLFNGGAKPGEKGSAVMGAHVDNGAFTPGVFKKLSSIKKGDPLYYINERGAVVSFKVTDIKVYNRNQKDTSAVFAHTDSSRLNLITCFGTWLPREHTYDKRLVVFTEKQTV